MWHMLLMCLPLIAFGLWSLFSGGGAGALIGGLLALGLIGGGWAVGQGVVNARTGERGVDAL